MTMMSFTIEEINLMCIYNTGTRIGLIEALENMTGYLTKADPAARGQTVALKIPNTEIADIFADTVAKLFTESLDNSRQKELMAALWNEDIEGATQKLNDFLWDTISYHDVNGKYFSRKNCIYFS